MDGDCVVSLVDCPWAGRPVIAAGSLSVFCPLEGRGGLGGAVLVAVGAHGHAGFTAEEGLEECSGVITAEGGDFLDRDFVALEKGHCLFDAAFLDRL